MEQEKIKVEIEEREGTPPGATPDGGAQDRLTSLLINLEAAFRIYDSVRERLSNTSPQPPLRSGSVSSSVASVVGIISPSAVKRARAALINFNPSRVPTEVRQDPTYLSSGDNLETSQRAVIQRNLTAFNNSSVPHAIRVTLSREDMAILDNVTTSKDGVVAGTIDLAKLLAFIEQRLQGTELYATGYAPFTALTVEAEADKRINRVNNPGG